MRNLILLLAVIFIVVRFSKERKKVQRERPRSGQETPSAAGNGRENMSAAKKIPVQKSAEQPAATSARVASQDRALNYNVPPEVLVNMGVPTKPKPRPEARSAGGNSRSAAEARPIMQAEVLKPEPLIPEAMIPENMQPENIQPEGSCDHEFHSNIYRAYAVGAQSPDNREEESTMTDHSRSELRRAVVMSEILGKPLALRHRSREAAR